MGISGSRVSSGVLAGQSIPPGAISSSLSGLYWVIIYYHGSLGLVGRGGAQGKRILNAGEFGNLNSFDNQYEVSIVSCPNRSNQR